MTHYKLFVPKAAAKEQYTKNESMLKKLQKRMVSKFNGYTKYQASGGWQNSQGELIEENVYVIEVITNNKADHFVKANGKWLLRNTDEKMILISIDGNPHKFT